MRRLFPFLILLGATAAEIRAGELSYNFSIRPILSDRCFFCHGPDVAKQKGSLRLDQRDAALLGGKSGMAAIKPGDPPASEMIRRLETADTDEKMPPADSHLTVSSAELALLRQWVQEGAKYEPHWSFVPPVKAMLPEVPGAWRAGAVNEIDAFVASRADAAGLAPAPDAGEAEQLRRVSLGLTGLPPSPEELEAFLRSSNPADAYAQTVDRLLESPAFAERLALDWLDAARFADTYGYQADRTNHLWPWRDWVLRAFRSNMPYDRFITAQLAGDLLPGSTQDDRLATAFNRLHRLTNEGGSVPEEMRLEGVADRVNTFGTAMLGLTLECCRCHDHKYDPVSIREYYRIGAFFDNIDEFGLYAHFNDAEPTPAATLYQGDNEARHRKLQESIAAAEHVLRAAQEAAAERFANVTASAAAAAAGELPKPLAVFDFDDRSAGKYVSSVKPEDALSLGDATAAVEGRRGQAVKFDGDNSLSCGGQAGAFERTDAFTLSVWLKPAALAPHQVIVHRCAAEQDAASQGWELLLDHGFPVFSLIHFWPGDAIRVKARKALAPGDWSQVAVTYDGGSRAAGVSLYLNGEKVEAEIIRDHLTRTLGSANMAIGGRFRDTGFRDGAVDDLMLFGQVLTPSEVWELAGHKPAAAPETDALAAWIRDADTASREAAAALAALRREENALINSQPQIMSMAEMKPRRPSVVRVRGAYDSPGDPVSPGIPASLLPLPAAPAGEAGAGEKPAPANRLDLAHWMTSPRQPLTARVYVNRLWQMLFGQGLVASTNDFGMQGRLPTHPELLDWLAKDFEEHGWDIRRLCRLMVMSGAYRRSSTATADQRERDPGNALLARFPRHRLPAELVRDRALAASGLLVATFGGPSVKPYQPAGLWEESGTGASYDQGTGDALYRRSLYTFIKRTVPPANMLTFDSQSREVCAVKREITNTPLQALVLLNDIQFIEAARVLAQRGLASGRPLKERMERVFTSLISRRPEPEEMALMLRLRARQVDWYAARPDAAKAFTATGATPVPGSVDPVLLAAETSVAQMLMSYDEFVTVR
ncbi:MAG: Planctomycete cytochrome [Verrucomicrobiales bacterium]|nr:Planctomycete cytochrome [Verrucomicrobiales bacterium]